MSGVNTRKCCCANACGCSGDMPTTVLIDLSGMTLAPDARYDINGTHVDWIAPDFSSPICLTASVNVSMGICDYYTIIPCGIAVSSSPVTDPLGWTIGPACLHVRVAFFIDDFGASHNTIEILFTSGYAQYFSPYIAETDFAAGGSCKGTYTDTGTTTPGNVQQIDPDTGDPIGDPAPLIAPGTPAITVSNNDSPCDPLVACDGSTGGDGNDGLPCDWNCSSCEPAYTGNLNIVSSVRGSISIPFCVSLELGVPFGGGISSCVYSDADHSNIIYCETTDGVDYLYFLHHDSTYGDILLRQIRGACPGTSWDFVEATYSGDTAGISDFAGATDCTLCAATAHSTGAGSTGSPAADSNFTIDSTSAYVIDPKDDAWAVPPTGSKWISNASDKTSHGTTHSYATTIHIPSGVDLDLLVIPFQVACDNAVTDILINGHSTGIEAVGFAALVDRKLTPSFWITGDNSIEFQTADSGGVEGLLVAWGTPNCDPLPVCELGIDCTKLLSIDITGSTLPGHTDATGIIIKRVDHTLSWSGPILTGGVDGTLTLTCEPEDSPLTHPDRYHAQAVYADSTTVDWYADLAPCPPAADWSAQGSDDSYITVSAA